ncbi:MAG: DUF2281 domain-containing protein [Blastocatellia bacterium]|nr:DUF2281 domain-containing protein [Blastocatellia bacterium]
MTVADKIHQRVLVLPEPLQAEVLNFIEFLLSKAGHDLQGDAQRLEDAEWSNLSLVMAMRGMEDEEGPDYTIADLKERF